MLIISIVPEIVNTEPRRQDAAPEEGRLAKAPTAYRLIRSLSSGIE
jgi:hypothetical protein